MNSRALATAFRETAGQHGYPASALSDNGMYYTARFARGGRTGLNRFETLLAELAPGPLSWSLRRRLAWSETVHRSRGTRRQELANR